MKNKIEESDPNKMGKVKRGGSENDASLDLHKATQKIKGKKSYHRALNRQIGTNTKNIGGRISHIDKQLKSRGLETRTSGQILKRELKNNLMKNKNESFMDMLEGSISKNPKNKAAKDAAMQGNRRSELIGITRGAKNRSPRSERLGQAKKSPARVFGGNIKGDGKSRIVTGGKHGNVPFSVNPGSSELKVRLMMNKRKVASKNESINSHLAGMPGFVPKPPRKKHLKAKDGTTASIVRRGKHGGQKEIPQSDTLKTKFKDARNKRKVKHMQYESFINILEGAVKAANKAKKNQAVDKNLRSLNKVGSNVDPHYFRGTKSDPAMAKTYSTKSLGTWRHVSGGKHSVARSSGEISPKLLKQKLSAKHPGHQLVTALQKNKNESFMDMLEGTVKAANKAKKKSVVTRNKQGRAMTTNSGRGSKAVPPSASTQEYTNSSGTFRHITPGKHGSREFKNHPIYKREPDLAYLKTRLKAKHAKNESFMDMLEGTVKAANKAKKNDAITNPKYGKQFGRISSRVGATAGNALHYMSNQVRGNKKKPAHAFKSYDGKMRAVTGGRNSKTTVTEPSKNGLKNRQQDLKIDLKAKHAKNEAFINMLEGSVKAANKAKKNTLNIDRVNPKNGNFKIPYYNEKSKQAKSSLPLGATSGKHGYIPTSKSLKTNRGK